MVNQPFSLQFTAQGGTRPYTWSASSLPLGLQISPSGVVSGSTPRAGMLFSRITVQDSVGRPASADVTFSFQPFLSLQLGSIGTRVTVNTPFELGNISSTPAGKSVTLSLVDSWIRFEVGTDTTCRQTAGSITVTTGVNPTPFRACISTLFSQPFVTALIRATATGFQSVADGFSLLVGSNSNFSASYLTTDLTSGAIEQDLSLTQGTFNLSPGISYIPAGGNWLQEVDNCGGVASCSVLVAGNTSFSALQTGEQVAARLDFSSGSSVVGSTIAKYISFPSSLSVAAGTYSGSYDWPFTGRATASGGTTPYTWSAAGLPTGLTISSDGLISGTPLQAGVSHAFLTATDSLGYSASREVTFSFQQGAPALALVPAKTPPNPTQVDGTGVTTSSNVGTLSSAPPSVRVTLTIASEDLQYFGFPSQNSSSANCTGTLSATTSILTTTPQAVYMCVHQIFIPLDKALRIYVHVTATASGYAPITVALPWESPAVYSMQVTPSSIDVSNGAGKVAVTVVSNNSSNFSPDVLQSFSAQAPWIKVASANSALPCVGRASCSFQISADPSQINSTAVGGSYSGLANFTTDGGLSASLSVSYKYKGSQLAIGSNSFRVIAGKPFTETANVSGGASPYNWSSPDMPGSVTLSASGTISGMLATTGVTQAHLTVADGTGQSATGVVTFTAVLAQRSETTDFDGDHKADFVVWRPSTELWYVIPSQAAGPLVVQWGRSGDVPVSGDFDGDGKSDYAVWRPSNGTWYVTPSQAAGPFIVQEGMSGDVPMSGDFDGDGKSDYTVWRPSNGTWYVRPSQAAGPFMVQWGQPDDVPVAGDFDGDGKSDYAVWRPSNGTWYILPSLGGGPIVEQWGQPGDVPVAGDFDGDGKSDFAIWRPSEGTWYILPSLGGGPIIEQWGQPGDVPVSGDFDGDGKSDYVVWRPSEGVWYIIPSGGSSPAMFSWGASGDVPL